MPLILPKGFHNYFWDVDAKKLDFSQYSFYIAERLLELGDFDSIRWLSEAYGIDFIKEVIKKSKTLSSKSVNFYSLYYNINPNTILCLQEEFQRQHRAIWPH